MVRVIDSAEAARLLVTLDCIGVLVQVLRKLGNRDRRDDAIVGEAEQSN